MATENSLGALKDIFIASDHALGTLGQGKMNVIVSLVSPPSVDGSGSRGMMRLSTLSSISHKRRADHMDQVEDLYCTA